MDYIEFKKRADSYIIRNYYTLLVLKDSDKSKVEKIKRELMEIGNENLVNQYLESNVD